MKKFLPLPSRWATAQHRDILKLLEDLKINQHEIELMVEKYGEKGQSMLMNKIDDVHEVQSRELAMLRSMLQSRIDDVNEMQSRELGILRKSLINMPFGFESLIGSRVVLFGSGAVAQKFIITYGNRFRIAYCVDNNIENEGGGYSVLSPNVLKGEDKSNLQIIILAPFPEYQDIEEQLRAMGLHSCIFQTKVRACQHLLRNILFTGANTLYFCCEQHHGFSVKNPPNFPYLDDAEQTLTRFLELRKKIIIELNSNGKKTVSMPCDGCVAIENKNWLFDEISYLGISSRPNVCQAKCIYCSIPAQQKDFSDEAHYPKMVADMIMSLKSKGLISNECIASFAGGEISVLPHKDYLLDVLREYKSQFATNAFIFDKRIAKSMQQNNSYIAVSIDAATPETFKVVKGFDNYERVVGNLLEYKKYGTLRLKYIIMPGINDDEKNAAGLADLVELLSLSNIRLSSEYRMPFRSVFFGLCNIAKSLAEKGCRFELTPNYYTAEEVCKYIDEYAVGGYMDFLVQRREYYAAMCDEKQSNWYNNHRTLVYDTELTDLKELVASDKRYAYLQEEIAKPEVIEKFMRSLQPPEVFLSRL